MKLPVVWGIKSLVAMVFKPRTRNWQPARRAIEDYIQEQEEKHKAALGLNGAKPNAAANDDVPPVRVEAAE